MVTERSEPGTGGQGVVNVDPVLLQELISLGDDETLHPLRLKREDVHSVKAVKLSDEELVKISKFQMYLFDRGFLRDNTFASLFVYLFNLAFTIHKQVAEEEARQEVTP